MPSNANIVMIATTPMVKARYAGLISPSVLTSSVRSGASRRSLSISCTEEPVATTGSDVLLVGTGQDSPPSPFDGQNSSRMPLAVRADRELLRVAVGHPDLAAQRDHRRPGDGRLHDLVLLHVVREALVVAVVEPGVGSLLDERAHHRVGLGHRAGARTASSWASSYGAAVVPSPSPDASSGAGPGRVS